MWTRVKSCILQLRKKLKSFEPMTTKDSFTTKILTMTTTQEQPTTLRAFPSRSILQRPAHSPNFLFESSLRSLIWCSWQRASTSLEYPGSSQLLAKKHRQAWRLKTKLSKWDHYTEMSWNLMQKIQQGGSYRLGIFAWVTVLLAHWIILTCSNLYVSSIAFSWGFLLSNIPFFLIFWKYLLHWDVIQFIHIIFLSWYLKKRSGKSALNLTCKTSKTSSFLLQLLELSIKMHFKLNLFLVSFGFTFNNMIHPY